MVRTTTDDATDAKPATDEAFDIIDEARDVLGDEHVADAMAEYDGDVRLAAVDLADAVCDEEDRRQAEVTNDTRDLMTPTDAEVAEAFGVDDVDDITDEMLEDVDTPEPPERVDVSGYKTAAGAAKKTHEALQEWAEFLGHDADEVVLRRPEDDYQSTGTWAVVWEGGPYEWASALSGGTTLTGFAGPRMNYDGEPEVAGLLSGAGFHVESHYSFDLLFYDA